MNDPTEKGLEIHPDAPETDADVFAFVLRELRKDVDPARPLDAVDFVHKARELFTANQPIGMDYLGTSLGLRFQDGTVLKFCDVDTGMQGVGGVDGGVEITNPGDPPRGGKGKTLNTGNWSVTGEQ